jgi:hypothetical protein
LNIIAGAKHWLRRAVDQEGSVLDVPVQSRRKWAKVTGVAMAAKVTPVDGCHSTRCAFRYSIDDKLTAAVLHGCSAAPYVRPRAVLAP